MIDFINYLINGALVGLLYALIAMGSWSLSRLEGLQFRQANGRVRRASLLEWMISSSGCHSDRLPLAFVAAGLLGF